MVINIDERISAFFCITIQNFYSEAFRKFRHISCLLRAGLVYSRSNLVLKYLTILFSECSLFLNLTVFVTARDIHSFLALSSQFQIHENAIKIGLNLKQLQRRKVPSRLWIITLTYLTGRTNKMQRILPRVSPSTYLNQFLIQPHPHFSATVNIFLNLIKSL